MAETAKHTPTPWHIELGLKEYSIWGGRTTREIDRVATLCGDKDFDPISNANAKLIVQAVNAHDELLAALKEVREFVAFAATKLKYQSPGREFEPNRESAEGTLGRMEQAIAKAEARP